MGLEKYSLNFSLFLLTGRSSAYSCSPAGPSLCSEGESCRDSSRSSWAARPALRILAESPDLEVAAELCDFYAGRRDRGTR